MCVDAQGLGNQVDGVADERLHIGAAEHRGLGHAGRRARAHGKRRGFAQPGLLAQGTNHDLGRVDVTVADEGLGHGPQHVVRDRAGSGSGDGAKGDGCRYDLALGRCRARDR